MLQASLHPHNSSPFPTLSSPKPSIRRFFFFFFPSLSLLLISKASVIQFLNAQQKSSPQPQISSSISLYNLLFFTQLCNLFLILSANATCFSLLFVAFNCLNGLKLSSPVSLLFLCHRSCTLLHSSCQCAHYLQLGLGTTRDAKTWWV